MLHGAGKGHNEEKPLPRPLSLEGVPTQHAPLEAVAEEPEEPEESPRIVELEEWEAQPGGHFAPVRA